MLGEWLAHEFQYGERAIGLMVRRERTQLIETIERAKQIYLPLGFKWHEQEKYFRSPKGSRLRFAYLERDADADAYQGHSYTRVYVEEAGTFPSEAPINKLAATLRSGHGVPCRFRTTFNPGGPGHQWVKARYIDPNPLGYQIIRTQFENPFTKERLEKTRIFIPSRVTDNKYLGADYVANLQMVGSPALVRAWLEGDWNVIEGAFFPEFNLSRHVIAPRSLPEDWARFRALDWGSARPFSVGWYAVSDGSVEGIPRGCLVKYREWYGCTGKPDEGLKIPAEEVAQGIKQREEGDKISYGVADPAIFASDGGPSIAERFLRNGITWRPADNARIAKHGALGGWDQLRARLKGEEDKPMILFFSNCLATIRTIPALQHDKNRAEDVDTESEDHAADETRYACMSRPYVKTQPKPKVPDGIGLYGLPDGSIKSTKTIAEIIRRNEKARTRYDSD